MDREIDSEYIEKVRAQIPQCCDARGKEIMDLIEADPEIRNKEIAARLGMTETNVSSYLCKIRKCIRKGLERNQQ